MLNFLDVIMYFETGQFVEQSAVDDYMRICNLNTTIRHMLLLVPGCVIQYGGQWRWLHLLTCWICMCTDEGRE